MGDIDLKEFDTVQVTFDDYTKPEGVHEAYLHIRNGSELSTEDSKMVKIEFVSSYLDMGKWQRWNILMDGYACVMGISPENRTVTISNRPHWTGQLPPKNSGELNG